MNELHEQSTAFQEALLKSERLRISIVIAAIGAVFIVRTVRTVMFHSSENIQLWLLTAPFIAVFVGYEFLMLRAVDREFRSARKMNRAVWIGNLILETCVPAFALAFLPSESIDPAYRTLANPIVLVFFLFISLSTLRLKPSAGRLSGAVAAVSYMAAAAHLGWRPFVDSSESLLSPQKTVFSYAILMVVAGFVAGAVAGEIRKQVNAALKEAETQRVVERLEHDLDVARSIQQSLLPTSMPIVEGFDIAAWNQPADQTGGDYYDWQPLPDGKVLVALADVTGHGIGPALLAAVCRAYARANFNLDAGLFAAMERINASLSVDLREGRFVTFVAAVCGPGSSRVELLSAGHGPLFLYASTRDRFDAMNAQGLPLGVSSPMQSDPALMLELERGDLLVLATDGFFEWANASGEQFGAERLEQVVRASRGMQAKEIISTLYRAVIEFSGGTAQQDDLTALVIKRTA